MGGSRRNLQPATFIGICYIKNGGKLGRKSGSVKTSEQKREEYKEVISLLRKGYSVRNVAKLGGVSTSTVQRIKKEFAL